MTTWYAQKGSCNIDSVSSGTTSDVWNDIAGGGGNWLDWSTQPASGDILCANNNSSIAINISINLGTGRLSTAAEGGTAGGGFTVASAVTIPANLLAGTTPCVVTSGNDYTATISGTVTGGDSTSAYGVDCVHTTGAVVNFTGTILGGTGTLACGVRNASSGALNFSNDITGGSGNTAYGLYQYQTGPVNITGGSITGGSHINSMGVGGSGTGLITCSANLVYTLTTAAPVNYKAFCYTPSGSQYIEIPDSETPTTKKFYYDVPSADYVLYGHNSAGVSGNLTLPNTDGHTADASLVLDTAHFGTNNATEGTYAGGGGGGAVGRGFNRGVA
jgi:hypothetical protein